MYRMMPSTAVSASVPYRLPFLKMLIRYGYGCARKPYDTVQIRPYAVYGTAYSPICNTSLIVPYLYRLSHAYISLYLVSLMTPLHCYAHASLSFEAIDLNSFATYSLPYCTSTCALPAAYVYFYDTYDMFFLQYIRTLVICQVAPDLVSFVNNRTINSIRALLTLPALLSLSSKPYFTLNTCLRFKS